MRKTDNEVLNDMILTMMLYGLLVQIVCFILPGAHLKMAVGLWIGVGAGIGMAIHMKNSLEEALVLGEEGARKYMQKSYAKRYVAVIVIFVAAAALHIADILTLFIGVMGLKLSAYLQPVMHKLFRKFKKSK